MKEHYQLIIRGGQIVGRDAVVTGDIAIHDGKLVSTDAPHQATADQIIDATGCIIMPGVIDGHVHLNEPGHADWEGVDAGSASLAAGGCTTYIDMPVNGYPSVISTSALQTKWSCMAGVSHIDYGCWGGLVPTNLDQLQAMSEMGVVGFKAFMSYPGDTGDDNFIAVDDVTLIRGMRHIAALGKILALHAESETITSQLAAEKIRLGKTTPTDYVESRPVIAEMEAVQRALLFAGETGCALHFVHISSAHTLELIEAAKRRGLNVTAETCPQYLTLELEELEKHKAVAKCAPPIRGKEERAALCRALAEGKIDLIATDHSPCPISMKQSTNMFEAWGGINGAQFSLLNIMSLAHAERIPLPLIARLMAEAPAKRFGFQNKGQIAEGFDADLVIVQPGVQHRITPEMMFSRHKHSPFLDKIYPFQVRQTIARGHVIYDSEQGLVTTGRGQLVR